jgi:uncharacterized protein (DUF1810 family)
MNSDLARFLDAQKNSYQIALSEIKSARKVSHWMWYIFPQIAGLGQSETSKFYAIKNIEEAGDYLNHEILGNRLREISNELLNLKENNARNIFNTPDDLKLISSMTLFVQVEKGTSIFQKVLDKFFNGESDDKTIKILKG